MNVSFTKTFDTPFVHDALFLRLKLDPIIWVAVWLVKIKLRRYNAESSRSGSPEKSIFRVLIQRAKPEKWQNVAVCLEINTSSPLSPVGTAPIPNPPLWREHGAPDLAWAGWGVKTHARESPQNHWVKKKAIC